MLYDVPGEQDAFCREEAARIRDRVLFYACGLDLDPVLAVELALESMRRTGLNRRDREGPAPGLAEVMAEFRRLLGEHVRSLYVTDEAGALVVSMPPLNRRPMLPEELDCFPVRRLLKRLGAALSPDPAKLS